MYNSHICISRYTTVSLTSADCMQERQLHTCSVSSVELLCVCVFVSQQCRVTVQMCVSLCVLFLCLSSVGLRVCVCVLAVHMCFSKIFPLQCFSSDVQSTVLPQVMTNVCVCVCVTCFC